MKKVYNILILSNLNDEDAREDQMILESFKKDGNNVEIKWIDYNEKLDNSFDVILKRNIWVQNKNDFIKYEKYNEILNKRLENKPIKKVNFDGIDRNGKKYLINYYKEGLPVIPSSDNLEDVIKGYDEFILKPLNSLKSAIGQIDVNRTDLDKCFKEGMLIQPKIKFKSEVQCYFVADELMYSLEFIPSKFPNYPKPILINLTENERKEVYRFIERINLKVGFLRLDFLRLENNCLVLLEIEATSPFMALNYIEEELRNKVIDRYKKNVYKFLLEKP